MPSGNLLTRRTLLAGVGTLALASGTAGCARIGASAAVDPSAREQLVGIELRLMSAYEQASALVPAGAEQRRMLRRRTMHEAHLRALGVDVWTTPTEPLPVLTDATPATWVSWLAEQEKAASLAQLQIASITNDLELARTAAIISAAERTHGVADFTAVPSKDWRPVNPALAHLDALDDALDAHYVALWVIGRVGYLLDRPDLSQVRKHFTDHTTMRDRIRRALIASKRTPAGPAPLYQLAQPVATAATAKSTLRDMERNVIATWLPVVMAARAENDPASAAAAIIAMGDSAVRATRWGNTEYFPGFGNVLTAAP